MVEGNEPEETENSVPNTQLHARAFDLPGWPCPPRLRDIPGIEESWGWFPVEPYSWGVIAQDEVGYLWVDGDAIPRFKIPNDYDGSLGCVLCWTVKGLGLWIHRNSMGNIRNISQLGLDRDRWIPVAVVLPSIPDFVKGP